MEFRYSLNDRSPRKKRFEDGPVESIEARAFFSGKNIRQIGEELGVWQDING